MNLLLTVLRAFRLTNIPASYENQDDTLIYCLTILQMNEPTNINEASYEPLDDIWTDSLTIIHINELNHKRSVL